jgi:hypothetical protein
LPVLFPVPDPLPLCVTFFWEANSHWTQCSHLLFSTPKDSLPTSPRASWAAHHPYLSAGNSAWHITVAQETGSILAAHLNTWRPSVIHIFHYLLSPLWFFWFGFVFMVLGFELSLILILGGALLQELLQQGTSCLSHAPAFLCCFSDSISSFCLKPALANNPTYASCIARITDAITIPSLSVEMAFSFFTWVCPQTEFSQSFI